MNEGARLLRRFFQSQEECAARLGIKGAMLSLLLAGKRKPSIEVAAAIECEFGVPCRSWVEEAAAIDARFTKVDQGKAIGSATEISSSPLPSPPSPPPDKS